MLEFFVFVNPLSCKSLQIERLACSVAKQSQKQIKFNLIPLITPNNVKHDYLTSLQWHAQMPDFCQVKCHTTQVQKFFHAVKICYGNKKAKDFLLAVQQFACNQTFDREIASQILIDQLELEIDSINKILDSSYVEKSILKDKQLAEHMKVKITPSIVVIDAIENKGYIFEGDQISSCDLLKVVGPAQQQLKLL